METSLKIDFASFAFFRDYPKWPSYIKEGNLGWSWREGTAPDFRQRCLTDLLPCRSLFSSKLKMWSFHVVVVQERHNEIYKKEWCTAELLLLFFLLIQTYSGIFCCLCSCRCSSVGSLTINMKRLYILYLVYIYSTPESVAVMLKQPDNV